MKKRIPYTEPYTPEETAELAKDMEESFARMEANASKLIAHTLRRIWADPEEAPLTPATPPESPLTALAQNPK